MEAPELDTGSDTEVNTNNRLSTGTITEPPDIVRDSRPVAPLDSGSVRDLRLCAPDVAISETEIKDSSPVVAQTGSDVVRDSSDCLSDAAQSQYEDTQVYAPPVPAPRRKRNSFRIAPSNLSKPQGDSVKNKTVFNTSPTQPQADSPEKETASNIKLTTQPQAYSLEDKSASNLNVSEAQKESEEKNTEVESPSTSRMRRQKSSESDNDFSSTKSNNDPVKERLSTGPVDKYSARKKFFEATPDKYATVNRTAYSPSLVYPSSTRTIEPIKKLSPIAPTPSLQAYDRSVRTALASRLAYDRSYPSRSKNRSYQHSKDCIIM